MGSSLTGQSLTTVAYLNVGDTIHQGGSVDGNSSRSIYGDDTYPGGTGLTFTRID